MLAELTEYFRTYDYYYYYYSYYNYYNYYYYYYLVNLPFSNLGFSRSGGSEWSFSMRNLIDN